MLLDDKDRMRFAVCGACGSARYVLPWVLSNPAIQNSALPGAILSAIKQHPEIPLAQDAYEASDLAAAAGNGPALPCGAADQTTKLIQRTRVGVYRARSCPVDPTADSAGTRRF